MHTSQITRSHTDEGSLLSRRIRLFAWILTVCWTLLIGVSVFWNYYAEKRVFYTVALAEARAVIERDALYRRWGSSHGGVYVPVTPHTPPNPYLSNAPDRVIRTPSGKELTLINPAYMTRQVNELANEGSTFLGRAHLTSLKPIRPENAPDPWEQDALRTFESGSREISGVVTMNGKQFMRLMRPFVTDKPCLKCHAAQGYTVGSIRGGISVLIPMQPLLDASRGQVAGSFAFHGIIWLLGLGGTWMGARRLSKSARAQKQIENELNMQTRQLEAEIAERQKVQESLQKSESLMKIVADYSSNWEYWRLPDDSFLYISPSVQELTGYSVEEFNSDRESIYQVIHPEDRTLFRNHTHELGPSGQILPIEMRIVRKNGDVRWIGHVCQQVYTPDGLPWGWRASNLDITDRKQMEHELEQLNHTLEERINLAVDDLRNKDQALIQQGRLAAMGEMINNIAHQWRQPLNNIGLIIQNLQFSYEAGAITHDEMDQEVGKAMEIIMHMSHTIDDFRNFFREDKKKVGFIVSKAVRYALGFVSATLTNHGVTVELEEDEPVTIIGYYNEYAQVLLNILSNTRETCTERCISAPRIHIRITSENGRSVVYIRDNCGGIADDVLPKIFDPYFTTRTPDKGTGIGLYMSKVIIEQHMGGRLDASNYDDGAEFRIEV